MWNNILRHLSGVHNMSDESYAYGPQRPIGVFPDWPGQHPDFPQHPCDPYIHTTTKVETIPGSTSPYRVVALDLIISFMEDMSESEREATLDLLEKKFRT